MSIVNKLRLCGLDELADLLNELSIVIDIEHISLKDVISSNTTKARAYDKLCDSILTSLVKSEDHVEAIVLKYTLCSAKIQPENTCYLSLLDREVEQANEEKRLNRMDTRILKKYKEIDKYLRSLEGRVKVTSNERINDTFYLDGLAYAYTINTGLAYTYKERIYMDYMNLLDAYRTQSLHSMMQRAYLNQKAKQSKIVKAVFNKKISVDEVISILLDKECIDQLHKTLNIECIDR